MSKYNLSNTDESNELSDTSPFITSDMYNALMKNQKTQEGLVGGAKSSSTSSTSSIKKHIKNSSTEKLVQKNSDISSDESMTGGEFNYISSSARTEGNVSSVEEAEAVKQSSENNNIAVSTNVEAATDSVTELDTDNEIA